MHVALVNQYFWPDRAATAQLLADLAEDLAAAGHRVTAIAGQGSYVSGREGRLCARESWRGVDVRRVPCSDLGRGSTLARLADYGSFLAGAGARLAWGERPDVAVLLSTPPLVATLGLLARWRGARFVYKVEDLYPDVAVALGALAPGGAATRALQRLAAAVLRRSDLAVALDESMADRLREKGASRVEVVPNWADGDELQPRPGAAEAFRAAHGLDGRLVVLYSGNLGLAHRFDALLDALRGLQADPVTFLVVGHGPRLAEVEAAGRTLSGLAVLPPVAREDLPALYAAADLHVVSLRDEVAGLLVPSKYAAALAAARPVLLLGGERTALFREVGSEGLGWAVPHDPTAIEAAIREALADPAGRRARGDRGRILFESRYDRRPATRRWRELLEDLVGAKVGRC